MQVPTKYNPIALTVNSSYGKIYTANYSGSVTSINYTVDTAFKTIFVGSNPCAITCDPFTYRVFVADSGSNDVKIINGTFDTVWKTVTIPEPVAITMGTKFRVWVASALGYVYEINDSLPTNDSVWVKVKAGVKPCAIAANSKNNKIYVANYGLPQQNYQSTVTIIHGVSDSAFTVNVGTNPASIAVNVRDSTVYVANRGSGDISVIK